MGTEWLDWQWSDHEGDWNLKCRENHYHYNKKEGLWLVNGGYKDMSSDEQLGREDIWYYQSDKYGKCIGCEKIASLQCAERCLMEDECDDCPYLKQIEPEDKEEDGLSAGAIFAIIFVVLGFIGGIFAYFYYRKKTDKTLCPTPSELKESCECPSFCKRTTEIEGDNYHRNTGCTMGTVNYVE